MAFVKYYKTLWTVPFSRYSGSISICYIRQWLKYSEWIWWFEAREGKKVKYVFANTTAQREKKWNPLHRNTSGFQIWLIRLPYVWIWQFEAREGKKVKYVFANTTAQREKKLNPHTNSLAVVKMNEINPKYENTRKIHRLLTNQNPGFLYKM
jgi:hypothetical protein